MSTITYQGLEVLYTRQQIADRVAEMGAEITRDLYLCGTRKLMSRLSLTPHDVRELLVIGHNPDLHEIALWLAGSDHGKLASALHSKFPTAAMAIFEIDAESWEELEPRRAALVRFATPAEFAD